MSSTDGPQLRRFFRKKLVPTAARLQERGVRFFPLDADAEAESWYEPGPAGEPEFTTGEPEDCARELRELWLGQGLPELAPDLMKLADRIKTDHNEESELPPELYVMY